MFLLVVMWIMNVPPHNATCTKCLLGIIHILFPTDSTFLTVQCTVNDL